MPGISLGLLRADDIRKKDGTLLTGRVVSVSNGQVMFESHAANGGVAKFPIAAGDISSVTMPTPDTVTKVQNADAAKTIATLEPVVKNYAGLPADWVVAAMGQLADAYADQNKLDLAQALYSQIDTLYPGSKYHAQAVAGNAKLKLKAGKPADAVAMLQPVIDLANKDIAPSPSDGALYAGVFLVYGNALAAENKLPQALEAYLTVKTMYYQDTALAQQADQLAKGLRDRNPGLGID